MQIVLIHGILPTLDDSLHNNCMAYVPVIHGDNPRALASGLSPIQMDTPLYNYIILQHLHQCSWYESLKVLY